MGRTRKFIRYGNFLLVLSLFIGFNYTIVFSLRDEKVVEEDIKPKIVLISHIYSNPYWQYIKQGAERAAKERNAVIDFQGPDSASAEEGVKFINMAYAAKVSGIITYVQEEDKYNTIIDKVVEGGIPIITIDSDAENSKRLAYIGTDNIKAGKVGAKEVINQVGTEGKVAIIMGGRSVKNQVERVKGFTDYISQNSNLVISEIESSDSYILEAELAAKKILAKSSDIKALFCTSAQEGQGVAKAINSFGLRGKVKVICFDDLPETLDEIKYGTLTSTIVQKPYIMGYNAVNIMMDNLEGKEKKGVYFTDVLVVGKDNLTEFLKERGGYISDIK